MHGRADDVVRFIPAYAGNALSCPGRVRRAPVHPRIRGERMTTARRRWAMPGSSPHTRGTRGGCHQSRLGKRFIPAYAGNARKRSARSRGRAVHPRIRGERPQLMTQWPPLCGSSPHTRGTRRCGLCRVRVVRFIPAYAGNAACRAARVGRLPVHPRIRGERPAKIDQTKNWFGSSPHTRGTPVISIRAGTPARFIPAYAGNASSACGQRSCSPVHPRIRGERSSKKTTPFMSAGSSPHTRGTHFQ